ncbi:MAG: hypothetical protein WC760_10655 [Bacteroidia bacterium]|jgi:hypothetical protein
MARKSWTEKFNTLKTAEVKRTEKAFADIPAGARMLIATPAIVEEYIRNIPKGHSTHIRQMRKDLAAMYHAEYTCPVTSGIFIRIVAEKAYEEFLAGKKRIAPFWRILDPDSPAAKKLSFGTSFILQQRISEGIEIK